MSRINTNVSSLVAQNSLNRATTDLGTRLERLSTGLRINRGSDDPSGLIASERLRSEIRATDQAVDNAERASNVIATTEGAPRRSEQPAHLDQGAHDPGGQHGCLLAGGDRGQPAGDRLGRAEHHADQQHRELRGAEPARRHAGLRHLRGRQHQDQRRAGERGELRARRFDPGGGFGAGRGREGEPVSLRRQRRLPRGAGGERDAGADRLHRRHHVQLRLGHRPRGRGHGHQPGTRRHRRHRPAADARDARPMGSSSSRWPTATPSSFR